MAPKKKDAKKKDAKGGDDEHTGPNIYKELVEKKILKTQKIEDLVVDLNAPLDILKKENVEFEILVDRLEHACMRVEEDNKRLQRMASKVTEGVQNQDNYKVKSL